MLRITLLMTSMLLCCRPSMAQSYSGQLAIPLQFEFLNPGARSLSLGSAFTGLADDATAAFSNPAGLDQMSLPEVAVEGRLRRTVSPFLERGRFGGTATGIGIDTIVGPAYTDLVDTHAGPAFVSFVFPRARWAVAAYRHESLRVSQKVVTQGAIVNLSGAGSTPGAAPGDFRQYGFEGNRNIAFTAYGVSGAFRLTEQFSVGAGLILGRLDLDSQFHSLPATAYGPSQPSTRLGGSESVQAANDRAAGAVIGAKWVAPTRRVQIGAAYRRSPEFHYEQRGGGIIGATGRFSFKVPDVSSVGIVVRLTDALLVVTDYDYVHYAQLKADYVDSLAAFSRRTFDIDGVSEFHAGVEYVFPRVARTPAIRAGFWHEPTHSVRYIPSGAGANDAFESVFNSLFEALLPQQEDRIHATLGGGMSIHRRLEINGAVDVASNFSVASVSAILRF